MNVFLWAFELAHKEYDLSKDDNGRYTNPLTASLFKTYADALAERFPNPNKPLRIK
jgi:hypothetical protein